MQLQRKLLKRLLKKEVAFSGPPTKADLIKAIEREFRKIPQKDIDAWIDSWWTRMEACKKANGEWVGERELRIVLAGYFGPCNSYPNTAFLSTPFASDTSNDSIHISVAVAEHGGKISCAKIESELAHATSSTDVHWTVRV